MSYHYYLVANAPDASETGLCVPVTRFDIASLARQYGQYCPLAHTRAYNAMLAGAWTYNGGEFAVLRVDPKAPIASIEKSDN